MKRHTIDMALEIDQKALTALDYTCVKALSGIDPNSAEGKPFADLQAAIYAMLDLITEASAAQEAR